MGLISNVILVTTLLVALCFSAAVHEHELKGTDSELEAPDNSNSSPPGDEPHLLCGQSDPKSYTSNQHPKQKRQTPNGDISVLGEHSKPELNSPGQRPKQKRETSKGDIIVLGGSSNPYSYPKRKRENPEVKP